MKDSVLRLKAYGINIAKQKLLEYRKHEQPTMYKNNSRNSSSFKSCIPLQLSCNLTGMKPTIGYYSYTERYGA